MHTISLIVVTLLCLTLFLSSNFNSVNAAKIIRKGIKDWGAVDWAKLEHDWVSIKYPKYKLLLLLVIIKRSGLFLYTKALL